MTDMVLATCCTSLTTKHIRIAESALQIAVSLSDADLHVGQAILVVDLVRLESDGYKTDDSSNAFADMSTAKCPCCTQLWGQQTNRGRTARPWDGSGAVGREVEGQKVDVMSCCMIEADTRSRRSTGLMVVEVAMEDAL